MSSAFAFLHHLAAFALVSAPFLAKLALFVCIGLLSIYPTVEFLSWRKTLKEGRMPPLITPPSLRVGVRRLVEPVLSALPVISLAELPPSVKLNSVATWELNNAA